ncbi:MAG: hypothetical protein UV73_C0003G0162 [Candidatus Gottesmanbacteria bacterium GW2011_GWA2_43_14]|uniref:3-keto-5-aminohexanoate cleavage protein n=1 Tax=Candidatus Gottesmanbacteria bacterium GW2011_GWA2_43_14 TaxID=1618443 RepID=A0A0G1DK49_9BACT|nr:MAG: hypothetical protein UV73_C0003G0162 [Candidatus Gottesmanbacteria bacterium GW2011_GWA2_43_14]
MISAPLIINVCLTGNVPGKKDNPSVPLSPPEIIRDAAAVIKLGATMLHLHARDKDGKPHYHKNIFAEIITGIRKINSHVVICATTSGRIFQKHRERSHVLELNGGQKPDFASLTLGSFNFPKEACLNSPETIMHLASVMKKRKIQPEWEIFEPGMINYGLYLIRKGLLDTPRWINIFLGSLGTSPFDHRTADLFLSMMKPDWRFAITGVGKYQYPANLFSLTAGGHIRVGLEDSFYMDGDKKEPATNAKLVERIIRVAKSMGRPLADTRTTRKLLGL